MMVRLCQGPDGFSTSAHTIRERTQTKGVFNQMISRRSFVVASLVAFSSLGVALAQNAGKSLEGSWATDGSDGINAVWTFKGDKLEADVNGNTYKADFKVNETAKPHSTMDITISDSPDGESKNRVGKAIYKMEEGKLVICVSMPGQERQTEFSTIDDVQYKFELKKK